MVCSCQAGLQTVLKMLKGRASPSCVRRWGATPHIPRRQLRVSLQAWPAEFDTHRVTCGHSQPEMLTSESRELPEHRDNTAVNGSRTRLIQRSVSNDTSLCSPNGYHQLLPWRCNVLGDVLPSNDRSFYFPVEDTSSSCTRGRLATERVWWRRSVHKVNSLGICHNSKNLMHHDSTLCMLVSSVLLSFSWATLRT